MRVRFKGNGQTGNIPDNMFDPNQFERLDAPSGGSTQQNDVQNAFGTIGNFVKGAYDFLKPNTYASMVEPVVQGTAKTAMALPDLIKAASGRPAETPEEQERRDRYVREFTPIQQEIKQKYTNPMNYVGAAGELALYGLPMKIEKAMKVGQGVAPWVAKKAVAGGIPSFIYGLTRPEDKTTGDRVGRAVTTGMIGATSYPLISALTAGVAKIPGFLRRESEYQFGKMAPTLEGKNLNEVDFQEKVTKDVMKRTTGLKPETIAKQLQKEVSKLSDDIQRTLDDYPEPVAVGDVEKKMTEAVAGNIQGFSRSNQGMTEEYVRLMKKATKYINQPKGAGEGTNVPLFKGSLGDLFKGKQELGKDLAENGVFERIQNGSATSQDRMAKTMYDTMKDIIDEKLQAGGQKGISELTELQHRLIEGGLAQVKLAKGIKTSGASMYELFRGLPGIRLLFPYIQAGETAALREIHNLATPYDELSQLPWMQEFVKMIPSAILQNKFKTEDPQASPRMIRVIEKSSGRTGTISEEEYDPSLYTPIE